MHGLLTLNLSIDLFRENLKDNCIKTSTILLHNIHNVTASNMLDLFNRIFIHLQKKSSF